ncbi:bifunctional ornithine acetyltransferase/N-acetylglutamate synthase [Helicobacter monodelphidis]|uniref:bifunctional glutamate N-acetyltransferase/amino-acid acetyltransferase ArgJ n=1 Tax=Helicobacter sp. 15-1451 TaxID=2004995 RepID=UPI000DCBAE82|nr:bifunctional glutamate N-acetyltransferase/amino-acid acetyltransferase ArgJ [Helicobacter sp. 15-1451]RAX58568.1 bifunctional ornithine acetyltransferase/N-acetylglutamate synthase [Helicobacter sp. 15-1451]
MFSVFSIDGGVCAPKGFYADGLYAGLKAPGKLDVAFVYSEFNASLASVFTSNHFCAAPIVHAKSLFQTKGKNGVLPCNFILVNAKNANALTGEEGLQNVNCLMQKINQQFQNLQNPIMASTGVIGVQLPTDKISSIFNKINLHKRDGAAAAQAIMTTDAYSKEIAFEIECEGKKFRIGAMCKGAGMICPSMATLLCFVTTDAALPTEDMNELLSESVEETFNTISVDGDMSTNDSVFLMSNGASGFYHKEAFRFALREVLHKLAIDIARDGEGANKLVAFEVVGAKTNEDAKKIARNLSNSLLVKTAIFGEDPNWGRIASTIGASGVECSEYSLSIFFDEVCVYERGKILFTDECEKKAAEVMQREHIKIICNLGLGEGRFKAYGCDLGYNYVKINADYRS